MIFHDRIYTLTGGGRDGFGNVRPLVRTGPFPAELRPIRSSETIKNGTLTVAIYRLVIGRTSGKRLNAESAIERDGVRFTVQGDVEPHYVRGRLHHYEATVKRG